VERAEEAMGEEEMDVSGMLRGKFTLRDMYKQLDAVSRMGPLKQIMSMLPLGGADVPSEAIDVTSTKMARYRVIMDSMTPQELDDPNTIGGSRIHRIARGAGSSPDEVRELLKYYRLMQRALKGMRGGKFNLQRMMRKFSGM
jgi:signal recognition particle subunit SRP54